MPLHCRSSPSSWLFALPCFRVISTIAEHPSGVKMQFWTSSSIPLHNALFILLKLDKVIVLSAPRSEEHINFQPWLLHLHTNLSQQLSVLRDASACVWKSHWGWEAKRLLIHLVFKVWELEVSQIQWEIKDDLTQVMLFTVVWRWSKIRSCPSVH